VKHGKYYYEINREHPLVSALLVACGNREAKHIRVLLSVLEQTVPVPTIVVNAAEAPDGLVAPFSNATDALRSALELSYKVLVESGSAPHDARLRLLSMEPFSQFPEVVMALNDSQIESELPQ